MSDEVTGSEVRAEHQRLREMEINEAVARKLGWIDIKEMKEEDVALGFFIGIPPGDCKLYRVPDYCHDIQVAWEILDRFDYSHSHNILARSPSSIGWHCQLNDGMNCVTASGDTAPMAICLAFLQFAGERA